MNPTDQETTYRLSLVPIRIDEHGKSFREFSANEWEILSQRLIRFSPRKVTIPAKGWQTVRLMVRKPADLPPGEYRTHLQVMPLADNTPLAENTQPTVKHTTAQIDMHISVTIPIIIRHQETNVTITPLAAKLSTDNRATTLQLTLQRNGNQSTAMRIEVYNTDANGQQQKITESQGIHFYTPNTTRTLSLPLPKTEQLSSYLQAVKVLVKDHLHPDHPLLGEAVLPVTR